MSASLQQPQRAFVRPRVTVSGGTVPRLLEEEVGELLAQGVTAVQLLGPPSSGRTTALVHLAATFAGDARLGLRDTDRSGWTGEVLTVEARERAEGKAPALELVPWNDDDALEYLLKAHRERAAAAFAAWQREPVDHGLGRWPGLCITVLDHLACERAGDVVAALRLLIDEQLAGGSRVLAGSFSLQHCTPDDTFRTTWPDTGLPLLAVPVVRAMLAAAHMLQLVRRGHVIPLSRVYWSATLLAAVRRQVRDDPAAEQPLRELCQRTDGVHLASVMSLLCAAVPGFRPPVKELGDLTHAFLAGADLHELRLQGSLDLANCEGADLRAADLRGASADRVRLRGARLEGAVLDEVRANGLAGHHLQAAGASLVQADLTNADLDHAVLDGANLRGASLSHAWLKGTSLRDADLGRADLRQSHMEDADLRSARCRSATLAGVDLRSVLLEGVDLDQADLSGAELTGMSLPGLQAEKAQFTRAWLTATHMPGAMLSGASFVEAGLADVDWHGADLRLCDFTNAAFHLGSSRSGLVNSPIAGEGSRTGFYTDESLEHRFQAPEDVRKANLRDCDLRGARLQGCDFYLVDLRGAKLDREQVVWLRRCRAILDQQARAD